MYQYCPKCRMANHASTDACYACGEPLAKAMPEPLEPVAVSSDEPGWRLEVAHRLASYRRRRSHGGPDDSQTSLPFVVVEKSSDVVADATPLPQPPNAAPARQPPAPPVGIEIAVSQPAMDFSAAEEAQNHPSAPLIPVADLEDRRKAGVLDASFLFLAYAGFLALFGSLGGQITVGKLDAAVYAVTFFLFYAQYFALFTFFEGATPGMRICGLRVVSFDGSEPASGQLLWRSFGYMVSAGSLFLGFMWSLWDEDRLTWQDRISQTYITHAPLE